MPDSATHEKSLDNRVAAYILRRTMNAALITIRHSYLEPALAGAASTRARAVHNSVRRAAFTRFNEDKNEPMR